MSIKGEIKFEAEGEDYILLLDFNALCDLEEELPGLMDGTAEIKSPSAIRAVFHAGLSSHHSVDLREAGRIIHDIGLERAADLVKQSFDASFGGGGEVTPRPQKTRPKTGAGNGR